VERKKPPNAPPESPTAVQRNRLDILKAMPKAKKNRVDAEYLERARREALRRDYRLLRPGQRVEQAAVLSKEMTRLAARSTERD
jgi:hypothetical protein